MGEAWHTIGPVAGIPEGALVAATVGGESLILVRRGSHVTACAALCPHKFGNLADGRLEGGLVTCPMHTATFDLETGHPGAGQEWAGHLAVYPTRVREGLLEVFVG